MTPDQLESAIVRIEQKMDRLLQLLEVKPQPHLKQAEFARRTGMHPNTVCRKVRIGQIRTEKGRIPYSELRKFVS